MVEEENEEMMSMNSEIAERLGVVAPGVDPSLVDNAPRNAGRRSLSNSPDRTMLKGKSRVFAAVARCKAPPATPDPDDHLIVELIPFRHMLPPETGNASEAEQRALFDTMLDVGLKAYQHLMQYVVLYGSEESLASGHSGTTETLSNAPHSPGSVNSPSNSLPPYAAARLASLESEVGDGDASELESISMLERIDQAYETLIELGDLPTPSVPPGEEGTPQFAANALGLFSGAALRRPPTRVVESLMAAAQESAAAHSDRTEDVFGAPLNEGDEFNACEDGLISLACSAGYADLAMMLLSLRGSTTFSTDMDCTPLMEACASGALEVVRCLLSLEADVNIVSATQNSALIYASAAGHEECVRLLLDTNKCNVELRNENGHCALMEAASGGHLNIVKMLIDAGCKPTFATMNSDFKESALTLAAYKGHVEIVNYLIHLDCNKGRARDDSWGDELHTALMETSMDGHVEVAKVLLDCGAPVNMTSESYESPLTLACCGGHDVLARMLLEAGAFVEEPNDESYTPLMEASREGHAGVVQVLLEHGAHVNAQTEETGETALTVAACGGYTDVLEVLVKNGGDLELGANTPLMEAAQEGHVGTVMYIIGASRSGNRCPNLQSHSDAALALAAENGHLDVLEVLFTAGADINLDVDGKTPLMKAAKNGYTDIVVYLISKDAKVNYCDPEYDSTALSLACAAGHKDIVRHLLRAGADPNTPLKDGVTCIMEAAKNGFVDVVELMLDHSGVYPLLPKPITITKTTKVESTNGSVSSVTAVTSQTTVKSTSVSFTRRKKGPGSTNTASPSQLMKAPLPYMVDPDPSSNQLSVYSNSLAGPPPAFPLGSEDCANTDWARAYYAWLANLYNIKLVQAQSNLPHVALELAADMEPTRVLLSVEELQKTLLTMAPGTPIGFPAGAQPVAPGTGTHYSTPAEIESAGMLYPKDLITSNQNIGDLMRERLRGIVDPALIGETGLGTSSMDLSQSSLSMSQMQTLANYVASLQLGPNGQPMVQASPATVVAAAAALKANAAANTQQPNPKSKAASVPTAASALSSHAATMPVPTTSGNYLSSTYESKKKSIAGLPMPSNPAPTAQKKPVAPTNPSPVPISAATAVTGTVQSQSTNTTVSTVTSTHAQTPAELKYVQQLQEAISGLSSDPRASRKTLQELFASENPPDRSTLKSFIDMFSECTRMSLSANSSPQNDVALNKATSALAALEQQTAAFNETLKVLRPTVTTLPGGSVTTTQTSVMHSMQFPNNTPSSAQSSHRRTHSEGDEVDTPKAAPAQRAAFNVDKATESNNDTPLTLACANGHKDMVNVLVTRGANMEHKDKKGFTPLILAATGGHVAVVDTLITHGADIEAQSERTKDTALSLACSGGRKEVVDLLIQRGAKLEHRNVSDYTPLSLAASGGYVEIVKLLLEKGAEINSRTGSKLGISPLMLAAMNGHKEATRILLEHGSDINAQIETNRNTALTLACFQGRTDVVRLLLEHNANVEHRAKTGLTPLMEAANGGYVEVGELLLNAHADPNTTPVPSSRDTALTIAADKGHDKFVEMLVHKGAFIDARNKKGCTALWLGCHGGHLETVQTLVKHHADVDAQDNRKVSPLMTAFRKGHIKVVKYIVGHVKQFPNEHEMRRYLTTNPDAIPTPAAPPQKRQTQTGHTVQNVQQNSLTPQQQDAKHLKEVKEMLRMCEECYQVISTAKNAQAEEANKAAESLLAQLEQEEEHQRTKKQKKQQKKEEKKKSKKSGNKKAEEESSASPMPEEDVATVPNTDPSPPASATKQESEAESDEDSIAVVPEKSRVSDESTPTKLEQPTSPGDNSMSNGMLKDNEPVASDKERSASQRGSNTLNSREKRQNNRRVRTENIVPPVSINSGSTYVQPLPSPVAAPKPSPQAEEWVKASKKKQSNKKTAGGSSVASSGPQKDYYQDENGAYGGWKDVELSRRRSNTLNVCSTVIARVIGRAGININAIREATGASIEVEKQGVRRDLHERQISIRGTVETCKNATLMINGLIGDSDATVNDIIRQVLRGNTSVASSSSESGSRLGSVCDTKTTAPTSGKTASAAGHQQPPSNTSTGNVWHQRMAARRQLENTVKEDSVPMSDTPPAASPPAVASDVFTDNIPQTVPVAPLDHVIPMNTFVPVQIAPSPPAAMTPSEEELRKAPGYRPNQQHSNPSPSLAANRVVDHHPTEWQSPSSPAKSAAPLETSSSPMKSLIGSKQTSGVPASVFSTGGIDIGLGNNPLMDNSLSNIWQDQARSAEPAWGSQLLLSNLSLGASDWTSKPEPMYNRPSSPSRVMSSSSNLTSSAVQPNPFSSNDWMAPGHKYAAVPPSFSMPQQPLSSPRGISMPNPPTGMLPMPPRYNQHHGQPESSALFQQLATQIANHKVNAGVSSPFYPMPSSYGDSPVHNHTPHKPTYQSASQEFENLNTVLKSSPLPLNTNGDYNHQNAYPSSPSASRSIMPRIGAASYAPPPGFGGVLPQHPGSMGGANIAVPPPPMRPFYSHQQLPPPGARPVQHSSAFNTYSNSPSNLGIWPPQQKPNQQPHPQQSQNHNIQQPTSWSEWH